MKQKIKELIELYNERSVASTVPQYYVPHPYKEKTYWCKGEFGLPEEITEGEFAIYDDWEAYKVFNIKTAERLLIIHQKDLYNALRYIVNVPFGFKFIGSIVNSIVHGVPLISKYYQDKPIKKSLFYLLVLTGFSFIRAFDGEFVQHQRGLSIKLDKLGIYIHLKEKLFFKDYLKNKKGKRRIDAHISHFDIWFRRTVYYLYEMKKNGRPYNTLELPFTSEIELL